MMFHDSAEATYMAPYDPATIQPTMIKTVTWLRSLGFNTTDSGDGVINVGLGMEGALPMPHVFMVVAKDSMFHDADSLWTIVKLRFAAHISGIGVECSYSPEDQKCILALYGVTDLMFG
mgnify:CR=1 FL=1